MTTRKSGLLGLMLGMAFLAACEPKSEVIVTPPPPDTTPTIALNLVPEAATINRGGTVTLVPVVTGTTNQAVTFSSSNTSIATVSAAGVVTGVAAGTAVITAVSSADPRARDASTITVIVPPGPVDPVAPTINISSITQGGTLFPVNTANIAGQIDVQVNADIPVGSNVQRLDVEVVNSAGAAVEACRQTFTGTGEISVNAQVPVQIVCSINTADFDPATGNPRFPNGTYQIRARLIGSAGTPVATATSQPLVFNNASFISLRAIEASFVDPGTTTAKACVNAGSDPRSIAGPGSRWCGGDLVINLTPVIFGTVGGTIANDRVASATVSLTTSGVGVNGMSNCDNRNTALNSGAIAPEDQQRVHAGSAEFLAAPAAGTTALEGGAARNGIGFTNMGLTITDQDGDGFQDFPGCPSITLTANAVAGTAAGSFTVTFSAENEPDCDVNGTCAGTTGFRALPGIFDVEDRVQIAVNSVTVGGQAGPICINPDPRNNPLPSGVTVGGCGLGTVPAFPGGPFTPGSAPNQAFFVNPLNIDNSGPRILEFDLTPPGCQTGATAGGCFVNGAFAFAPRAGFFQSVDYGSDSQNANTSFVAGSSLSALNTVRTGADLAPGSVTANDLFLRVTVRDALGNSSGNRFLASCGAAPCFSGNTTTSTGAGNQFRFGVDLQLPEFDLAASAFPPQNGANDGTTFTLAFRDVGIGPSGFQGVTFDPANFPANVAVTGPVWVRAEFTNPNGTFCLDPNTGGVLAGGGNSGCGGGPLGNGFEPTTGSFNLGNFAAGDGYYRVRFYLQDAAGNRTVELAILTLIDRAAPVVGGVSTPSVIVGNASATFTADATDNRDLGDAILYTTYPGAGVTPTLHIQESAAPIPGAAYGPPLNTTGTATVTVPNFIRSIQDGLLGPIVRANEVTLLVRDQAGVVDGDICPLPAAADNSTTVAVPPNPPVGAGAVGNCRLRRENIANAVNAGITTGAFAETNFNTTTMTRFNLDHNATTPLCNQTTQTGGPATQPCPVNPTSATFTARATGPSATFPTPFVRVNFYYTDLITQRTVLFATSASPSVTDQCPAGATCPPTATERTYAWTAQFTPNQLSAGNYVIYAIGVRSNGQGLSARTTIDVAID